MGGMVHVLPNGANLKLKGANEEVDFLKSKKSN